MTDTTNNLNAFSVLAAAMSQVYYCEDSPFWQPHEALCHADGSECDGGASCSVSAEGWHVLDAAAETYDPSNEPVEPTVY